MHTHTLGNFHSCLEFGSEGKRKIDGLEGQEIRH